MSQTLCLTFSYLTTEQQQQLTAVLQYNYNLDGLEETNTELLVYLPQEEFENNNIKEITAHPFTQKIIPPQNWNALWESNFEPVQVGNFCGIRAHFHPNFTNVTHEITITPKMSFGTGHHPTTYQVIQAMQNLPFAGAAVADFGTGSGILAILAQKLGASNIVAVDNDEWCITNTKENKNNNNATNITVIQAEMLPVGQYSIILANINKNILLQHMAALYANTAPNGYVVFSGILSEDEADMKASINKNNYTIVTITNKNNWLCITVQKQSN